MSVLGRPMSEGARKQILKSDEYRQPYYGNKEKSFQGEIFDFDWRKDD